MKLFFSDFSSDPIQHVAKELNRYGLPLVACATDNPGEDSEPENSKPGVRWGIFVEQTINAVIVAGVTFCSALGATSGNEGSSLKAAGIAFLFTWCVEMRKYRRI